MMDNTPTSFGLWLQMRRQALDLTQQELAERIACSRSLIRKIEADERRPSAQLAELLAAHLQIRPDERALFLQVARQALRVEHLGALTTPATLPLPSLTELLPAAPPPFQSTPRNQADQTKGVTLPTPITPLVGRATDLAALSQLLHDPACRQITLVGLGGTGKTRLALAVAAHQRNLFPDGICFVALTPVGDPHLLATTIATALGITLTATSEARQAIIDFLQQRHYLLILDNAEHLLAHMTLAADIVAQTHHVKILVTSRERLNLQSEWVFEVQGLPFPPLLRLQPQDNAADLLDEYSALQLFVERARQRMSDFDFVANWQEIVRICQLVEGMPLGIELAAAWVRMLTCQEIADEIERNIDFLSVNLRDLPLRHRSLRAVIEHSWALLTPTEQQVLQQLAVLRGTFTRPAAEQVAGADLLVLAALVSKSLLQREAQGRYDLHELVRQYAIEQLRKQGLLTQVQRQYTLFYLALAEAAAPNLLWADTAKRLWRTRLEAENHHLRATLEWNLSEEGDLALAMRLAAALGRFWYLQGYWREGQQWLTSVLARSQAGLDPHIQGRALLALGAIQSSLADFTAALATCSAALTIFRTLDDSWWTAWTLFHLALINMFQGNAAQCATLASESLALFRAVADSWGIAVGLAMVGAARIGLGDYEAAKAEFQESSAIFRTLEDLGAVAGNLNQLGSIALLQGDLPLAEAYFQESLPLAHQIASKEHLAWVQQKLGEVALLRTAPTLAYTHFQDSFLLRLELGDQAGLAITLIGLATAAAMQAQFTRSAQLWGAAASLSERYAVRRLPQDQMLDSDWLAKTRTALGETAWHTAASTGRQLSVEQLTMLVTNP